MMPLISFLKPRRVLLGAALAAAVAPKEKVCCLLLLYFLAKIFKLNIQLSVYSEPEPQLVLIDTPTELERQIGHARETVTAAFRDSYAYVQGWVSKWIGIEHAVERELFACML